MSKSTPRTTDHNWGFQEEEGNEALSHGGFQEGSSNERCHFWLFDDLLQELGRPPMLNSFKKELVEQRYIPSAISYKTKKSFSRAYLHTSLKNPSLFIYRSLTNFPSNFVLFFFFFFIAVPIFFILILIRYFRYDKYEGMHKPNWSRRYHEQFWIAKVSPIPIDGFIVRDKEFL